MGEIRTERPKSTRPKMSNTDRAKQFAPFAALGRLDKTLAYVERQINIGELEHIPEWGDASADIAEDI